MLQRWRVGFDPFTETSRRNLVWEKLPGLPLELWNEAIIRDIANHIGKIYFWDWGSFGQLHKRMAWVLVQMEFGRGLLADLEIRWGTSTINISIDYREIPFHCLICHETGRLKHVSLKDSLWATIAARCHQRPGKGWASGFLPQHIWLIIWTREEFLAHLRTRERADVLVVGHGEHHQLHFYFYF